MKHQLFLLIAILFISTASFSQTKQDSANIEAASLDYLEGYYTGNGERMKNALHEKLSKRAYLKNKDGNFILYELTAEELIKRTSSKNDESVKNGKLVYHFEIFDIINNSATVKITSEQLNFFDFLHLIKIDDKWKIINVLWNFE